MRLSVYLTEFDLFNYWSSHYFSTLTSSYSWYKLIFYSNFWIIIWDSYLFSLIFLLCSSYKFLNCWVKLDSSYFTNWISFYDKNKVYIVSLFWTFIELFSFYNFRFSFCNLFNSIRLFSIEVNVLWNNWILFYNFFISNLELVNKW